MLNQSKLFQSRYRSGPLDSSIGKHSQHRPVADAPTRSQTPRSRRGSSFSGWWQNLALRWVQRSQLSIQKITNARRDCWWHVRDPRSGKSFYAETLAEAIDWIEAHHLGK
ncbi:hypothetical protein [Acaryochloris sp. IP29b_bin.148]|uniref:hypothetical protein n=1 Tax=Acaryochloris sp. IP29b_bin.148 TaxID=2969218 RepID=UPI002626BEB1|nr:hypothetical protein [Acaryochloris sp. IP29b_bin.148]